MWYHDGDGMMNGGKTTKEISDSYQRQCSICRQILSEKKLIFSFVVDDRICLDCYKNILQEHLSTHDPFLSNYLVDRW